MMPTGIAADHPFLFWFDLAWILLLERHFDQLRGYHLLQKNQNPLDGGAARFPDLCIATPSACINNNFNLLGAQTDALRSCGGIPIFP
ncbi:MAG TPA: hypothetical protein PL061_06205 [Syntrophales bacterium]|jgi:hypothetical protein|nr:hypothetical protein [Syntrophales bacterium]